jgi:hypothetical protein
MIDPRFRSNLPEFAHYKQDSLLTLAAREALAQHKMEWERGVVDRDGGLTFYYNGMGQLPPAAGHGDSWYPGKPCAAIRLVRLHSGCSLAYRSLATRYG